MRKSKNLGQNGIRHTTSAPYHPATNILAERSVHTFKQALRSRREERGSTQMKLPRFLLAYRNIPHCTTTETPAVLMVEGN